MKMIHVVLLGASMLTAHVATAQAAKDSPVIVWTKGMPPPGGVQRETYGNHLMYVAHRDADGKVEVHQTQSDVLMIENGEADFIWGGEIQEPVSKEPNELLGSSIKGGTKVHLGPGDIVHVAPGTPHQFLLPSGTKLTYFILKINK